MTQSDEGISAVLENFHSVGHEIDAMARQLDRLLRDAAALTGKIEQALGPLARTILPRAAGHYLRWAVIEAAVRQAFSDRTPVSQRGMEQQPMEMAMRLVMRSAGENASRIRVEQSQKRELAQ